MTFCQALVTLARSWVDDNTLDSLDLAAGYLQRALKNEPDRKGLKAELEGVMRKKRQAAASQVP